MHALIVEDRDGVVRLEIKCRDCTTFSGEVVLHYFDLQTGQMVDTRRFRSVHELKAIKNKERRERQLVGSK